MPGRRAVTFLVAALLLAGAPSLALGAAAQKTAKKAKKAKKGTAPPSAPAATPVPPVSPTPAEPAPLRAVTASPVPAAPTPAPVVAPPPAPAPALAPLPPPPAALEAAPDAQVEADAAPRKEIGLRIGLKLALLVPSGRTSKAEATVDGDAVASKDYFASGAFSLQYAFPVLDRALSFGAEVGYYRLAGSGTRSFANDPDFGPELAYAWKMHAVPILAGLSFRLPIPIPRLSFAPALGFVAVWAQAQSTYESGAGVAVSDSPQTSWALGFWFGLEAAVALGPGSIVLEGRYLNARTDLGFKEVYAGAYNADLGDVQGFNLLLGYRFEL